MADSKCYSMRKLVVVAVIVLGGISSSAFPQQTDHVVPLVAAANAPLYPRMALVARIQGVVTIEVTTDGKKAVSFDAESGPPMLVKAAKQEILTWKFYEHKPTTFVTRFEYLIEEPAGCGFSNGTSVITLPLQVRINAKGLKSCDPAER